MNDFQTIYVGKKCFVIFESDHTGKFYYNGIILSTTGNTFIINDEKLGNVSLPMDKCIVMIKEG